MEQVAPNETTNYPVGYLSARLQDARYRKASRHLGGGWKAPVHGAHVFVADDGTVLAVIRTLGVMLPKKQRRYALRVEGVLFTRVVPLISKTKPINSDLAPYSTPREAMKAGSALIERLRNET